MEKQTNDQELEEIVLALLFRMPTEQQSNIPFELDHEDFSQPHNKSLFLLMEDIISRGGVIDAGVIDALSRAQINFMPDGYVNHLTLLGETLSLNNKDYFIDLLKRYSLLRKLDLAVNKIKTLDTSDSYVTLVEKSDSAIAEAISSENTNIVEKLGTKGFSERIRNIVENPIDVYGINTGVTFFDVGLDGIVPGLLTLIGGRPGTGKSALAQNMYYNIACLGQTPILCIDTETNKSFVENRLLAISSGYSFNEIIHGKAPFEELEKHIELIENSPIYYYYMPNLSAAKLRTICRKYQKAHGIQCIFIDFLGSSESENSSIELGKKIKDLHDISTSLEIGMVVFQQLNREQLDKQTGKSVKEVDLGHFVLSDQTTWYCDAAVGIRFPTQPEKAKFQCNRMADIPKHRFGKAGVSWPLNFTGGSMRFENVEVF